MVDSNDILGGGLSMIGKRLISRITPSEQPIMQSLARSITTIENQQARAIQDLIDALEMDIEHSHDPEAREKTLLEVADAVAEERFVEWYLDEVLGVDDAESLQPYVGSGNFEQQQREWWDAYRDDGQVEKPFDEVDQDRVDELSDQHVHNAYNVDLETFRHAVEFDRGEAALSVLAGPLRRHTQIITAAAETCQKRRERRHELEHKVDELERKLESEDC